MSLLMVLKSSGADSGPCDVPFINTDYLEDEVEETPTLPKANICFGKLFFCSLRNCVIVYMHVTLIVQMAL